MRNDHRPVAEKRARKELNHARRQVEMFRDRLLMSGNEPSVLEAYKNAQKDYEAKWQALLELTIPDMETVS